jgi:hypothetical protein
MKGKGFFNSKKTNIRKADENDHQLIINLDKSFFGVPRSNLLRTLLVNRNNLCYVSTNRNQLTGFVMAKVYGDSSELGPLVCEREHEIVAIDLLRSLLGKLIKQEVFLCVPEKESAIIDFLIEHDFRENFRVLRMLRGKTLKSDLIYLAESLERG